MLFWVTTECFRLQARSVTIVSKNRQPGTLIRITVDKDWRKFIQLKEENLELMVDESASMFDYIYIEPQFCDIS